MGGLIKDVANAEFVNHPRDTPQMIQDVRTVRLRWWWESRPGRWSQSLLLGRGDGIAHPKITQLHVGGAECRLQAICKADHNWG